MSSVNILADVFMSNESQKILKNKFTLFIGDSGKLLNQNLSGQYLLI